MPGAATRRKDTSISTYRAKRDFTVTAEPAPSRRGKRSPLPIFVVQKHQAHRAGLHWDFRLEHNGVLLSWAVRKGPSLDPSDKRIAVHVEDHPLDYAGFQGTIPEGQYGAGAVETWDRGTWQPLNDPDTGLRDGELKFTLAGTRLNGKFTLVRLRPRPGRSARQDNWLLIKGHDAEERAGANAEALEAATKPPSAPSAKAAPSADRPATGAKRGKLPPKQSPQLAAVTEEAPEGENWLTEIKFDGYRLLVWIENGTVRIVTRNGLDWTDRLPAIAQAVSGLAVGSALLDGELVALDAEGLSSFPALQEALSAGRDQTLFYYLFDLLHLNGWDLRAVPLKERKQLLRGLDSWRGILRYSDHSEDDPARMRREACRMGLEGVICKQGDAPYSAGRGPTWLKVKCRGREEFIVLGWTPPRGSRMGLGALHLGYYDPSGALHYAGGAGSGFSDDELATLRKKLDRLAAGRPHALHVAGERLDPRINWVRPELVVETSFISWSGAGRVRQAVYLGLRDDKAAKDVVRPVADPKAERHAEDDLAPGRRGPVVAVPPRRPARQPVKRAQAAAIVTARAPKAQAEIIEGVTLTHPDRELWPGITKRHLAEYWRAVAPHALPGLAHRPLAIVRCPEGAAGEQFFQKHAHGALPPGIRDESFMKAPYLAIDDLQGLVAMAQISAVELHAWGSTEADPASPDQIVLDLDPGEGVGFPDVVKAALDIRDRLDALGLVSFCRTTGGKGLHLVVPLAPADTWDVVKPFCKAFAESVSREQPDRFLSTVKKADRRGRILIDWLRNGMGATAIASFCPRARPGATVATPLAWEEVTRRLDPGSFTLRTVPDRLARQRSDPWQGFAERRQRLPKISTPGGTTVSGATKTSIVTARPPRRR
ncbi:MAG TPA: DNA ligase D [Acetobacteraceae bacterium]|nr:DNA ligase D [Acetobacteraceae bacterium]